LAPNDERFNVIMKRIAIKESLIYLTLFAILSLLVHIDLLSAFGDRISHMMERGNFFHPFIYTFILYIFIFFFRILTKKIVSLISKVKKNKL